MAIHLLGGGHMGGRRDSVPSHTEIYSYWHDKAITSTGNVVTDDLHSSDIEPIIVDKGEARCWACGKHIDVNSTKAYKEAIDTADFTRIYAISKVKSSLNRCHIIPHMLGGSDDDPGNYLLMCLRCHEESPDTDNPKLMFRWLYNKRHEVRNPVTGRSIESIMRIVIEECKKLNKDPYSGNFDNLARLGVHGTTMSDSTVAYAYIDTCKDI